jgi:hypothetical protein
LHQVAVILRCSEFGGFIEVFARRVTFAWRVLILFRRIGLLPVMRVIQRFGTPLDFPCGCFNIGFGAEVFNVQWKYQ